MDAPLFSLRDMFAAPSDTSDEEEGTHDETSSGYVEREFVEREHHLPGLTLAIREFSFHEVNANLVWPGTSVFAAWLMQNPKVLAGKRTLEIGSGTGILAIFLKKVLRDCDITTCDYDDEQIESNIAHNCKLNGIDPPLPHIRHTWGTKFPIERPPWEVIIASDILLYVKAYPALISTLCFLLDSTYDKSNARDQSSPTKGGIEDRPQVEDGMELRKGDKSNTGDTPQTAVTGDNADSICPKGKRCFIMSWRRRIGKKEEALFFEGCNSAGLEHRVVGPRTYCIFR
ncbi:hypothetical protein CBR_g4113 [Chara braunii]|uniref:Methyltransferase small domain-containing protein n=1 Tax=Chara braunii TaxID=69332 RepID=A0A388KHA4_CHABU|nr:hypothetical protein CBR_g4113 [Chara braunii]|eukprot:GBG69419.1 hypothetical protein CBR_g4113 [Chara braunii]